MQVADRGVGDQDLVAQRLKLLLQATALEIMPEGGEAGEFGLGIRQQ